MEPIFEFKFNHQELGILKGAIRDEIKTSLFKLSQCYYEGCKSGNSKDVKEELDIKTGIMNKLCNAKEYKEPQFVNVTNKFNIGDLVEYNGDSYFVDSIAMDRGIIYSLVKDWGDDPIDAVPENKLS